MVATIIGDLHFQPSHQRFLMVPLVPLQRHPPRISPLYTPPGSGLNDTGVCPLTVGISSQTQLVDM